MGLNRFIAKWLIDLEKEFELFLGSHVVDMGPQDFSGGFVWLGGRSQISSRPWSRDLYMQLGCNRYSAFDYFDPRGTACDFNFPPQGRGDAEVVTNFGTSEHIFNQFGLFRFIHETTAKNGVMLHSLPAAGGRDHGYFNYHPTFFHDLARFNNYEILRLDYFPHYSLQITLGGEPVVADLLDGLDCSADRVVADEARIKRATIKFFLRRQKLFFDTKLILRCLRHPRGRLGPFFDTYRLGDYVHVALRKTVDSPFECPIQMSYRRR